MNPQTTTKSVNIMKVHSIPCTSNIWLHVNVISMPAMFDWFESLVIQDCLMLHFCCLYYPVYSQAQIPCVYICCFCPIFSLVAHQVRFKHGKNSLYCGWMSHPLLPWWWLDYTSISNLLYMVMQGSLLYRGFLVKVHLLYYCMTVTKYFSAVPRVSWRDSKECSCLPI